MKSVIRYSALSIALTGLAFASFSSALSQGRSAHAAVTVNSALPAPLPCMFYGACYAPAPAPAQR